MFEWLGRILKRKKRALSGDDGFRVNGVVFQLLNVHGEPDGPGRLQNVSIQTTVGDFWFDWLRVLRAKDTYPDGVLELAREVVEAEVGTPDEFEAMAKKYFPEAEVGFWIDRINTSMMS